MIHSKITKLHEFLWGLFPCFEKSFEVIWEHLERNRRNNFILCCNRLVRLLLFFFIFENRFFELNLFLHINILICSDFLESLSSVHKKVQERIFRTKNISQKISHFSLADSSTFWNNFFSCVQFQINFLGTSKIAFETPKKYLFVAVFIFRVFWKGMNFVSFCCFLLCCAD